MACFCIFQFKSLLMILFSLLLRSSKILIMETDKHSHLYDGLSQDDKNTVDAIVDFLIRLSLTKQKTILATTSAELHIKHYQDRQ